MVQKRKLNIGPHNPEETHVFDWESMRVNLQFEINSRMNELGLSKTSLAETCKVSRSTIDRFFDPDCNVTFLTLNKMTKALGLTLQVSFRKIQNV